MDLCLIYFLVKYFLLKTALMIGVLSKQFHSGWKFRDCLADKIRFLSSAYF